MTVYIVVSYSEIVVENKPKWRRNKQEVCLFSIAAADEDFWQFLCNFIHSSANPGPVEHTTRAFT